MALESEKQQPTALEKRAFNESLMSEALQKQAASRKAKTPPREMPVTPTLPRMPKPHKRRGR